MRKQIVYYILVIALLVAFLADIIFGSVNLSLIEIIKTVCGVQENEIFHEIILNHRIPKALTAILAGSSLAVSGVLMQSLFHNPLAGPDVLGVNSGASLGVAILMLGATSLPLWIISGWGQTIAAILGACIILFLVILASIRIRQTITLLILGMMFSFFAGAIVSILQSISNPDTLKLFINWTFGSLSAVGWDKLGIMSVFIFIGLCIALLLQKQLNILLLGQNYADSLGVSVKQLRLWIILSTALLAGTSTAFTGPISFIGITVPHIARFLLHSSNHRLVLPVSILCGSIILLLCDLISTLPFLTTSLPINSVTSLFGAPIIIWIILKNKK